MLRCVSLAAGGTSSLLRWDSAAPRSCRARSGNAYLGLDPRDRMKGRAAPRREVVASAPASHAQPPEVAPAKESA